MDEEEYQEEDSYTQQGNPMENRDSVVEGLFDTEHRLNVLENAWREHAGRRFIKKQMAALRGIINKTNTFTRKTDKECRNILYRSVEAFIRDLVNEPTIKKKDYRTLSKTFEHALELFLGLPEGGHGSRVLKDALAGLNTPDPVKNDSNWLDKWKK